MRLRIKADNVDLSPASRDAIDAHFRLALGSRVVGIRSLGIVFSWKAEGEGQILCKIALRRPGRPSESVEETARDLETALDWAIWRLIHSLDRQALRDSSGPLDESPASEASRS